MSADHLPTLHAGRMSTRSKFTSTYQVAGRTAEADMLHKPSRLRDRPIGLQLVVPGGAGRFGRAGSSGQPPVAGAFGGLGAAGRHGGLAGDGAQVPVAFPGLGAPLAFAGLVVLRGAAGPGRQVRAGAEP